MLSMCRDYPTALILLACSQHRTAQRQVIAFAAAACEDDLFGRTVQDIRNAGPRRFNRTLSFASEVMRRRRITVVFREIGQHRLDNARIGGCGRSMVQVDWFGYHGIILPALNSSY